MSVGDHHRNFRRIPHIMSPDFDWLRCSFEDEKGDLVKIKYLSLSILHFFNNRLKSLLHKTIQIILNSHRRLQVERCKGPSAVRQHSLRNKPKCHIPCP